MNCKLNKRMWITDIHSTVCIEIGNKSNKGYKSVLDIESFLISNHISNIHELIEDDMNIVQRTRDNDCVMELSFLS